MSGLQKAGDFKIDSAKIITSVGTEIDISASIIIITFFEDTGTMALSGNILMFDTVNLASVGPLIGQEYLKLKIRTPSFEDKSAIIDFTENVFLIHSIQSRENVGGIRRRGAWPYSGGVIVLMTAENSVNLT